MNATPFRLLRKSPATPFLSSQPSPSILNNPLMMKFQRHGGFLAAFAGT
jgi:hypothetical protein